MAQNCQRSSAERRPPIDVERVLAVEAWQPVLIKQRAAVRLERTHRPVAGVADGAACRALAVGVGARSFVLTSRHERR
eukprot:2442206-Rhodomonas_salina.1